MSLISPDNVYLLSAALVGLAGFGAWIDTTSFGRRFSGVAIMLVTAITLGNIGVLPHSSTVYEAVWLYLVPVSLPLLLMQMNLSQIIREAGPLIYAFLLAVMGTLLGIAVGVSIVPLGAQVSDLAAIFAAGFIGGSMNFVAVAQMLEIDDQALLTAALAADNVAGSIHMVVAVTLPAIGVLLRWIPSRFNPSTKPTGSLGSSGSAVKHLNIQHLFSALTISLLICAISHSLAKLLGITSYTLLLITFLALLVGNLFPVRIQALQGSFELGKNMMLVLFVTIGAGADIGVMLEVGLMVFVFAAVVILIHLMTVLIGARLFKIDLADVVIASLACIGGPVAPAAIAASRGWNDLVTPALLVGLIGYSIATFIGIGVAKIVS